MHPIGLMPVFKLFKPKAKSCAFGLDFSLLSSFFSRLFLAVFCHEKFTWTTAIPHHALDFHLNGFGHCLHCEKARTPRSQRNKKCASWSWFSYKILAHHKASLLPRCWQLCQLKRQSHWIVEEVAPVSISKVGAGEMNRNEWCRSASVPFTHSFYITVRFVVR